MRILGKNVVYFSSIKVQQSWCATCMWFCSFQCVLHTVSDNDNMEVFGMYCNIFSMLIGNSVSDPLPCIWQVFLHVSTVLNGSQTVQLSLHSWRVHDSPVRRLPRRHTCTALPQCGCISRAAFLGSQWPLGTLLKDLNGSSRAKGRMLPYLCGSLPLMICADQ